MKRYLFLSVSILLFCCVSSLLSQDYQVPKNYTLKLKEDYAKYEPEIIECINYLENTALDKEADKRKEANAFLVKWLSGSPNVNITIEPYIMEFTKKNSEFLIIFMGGWTKYALANPDSTDKIAGNLAGLRSIIKVYKSGNGIKKDKNIKKIIKLDEEGKLDGWIREKIKSQK